ncbi:MAG: hypothetical protein ACI3VZ_08240 [Faecousia sp.]
MSLINAQALKELTPEEVFTFKVEACNDLVDRDFERFPVETLEKLASMYVGRTVIADHRWSSANQQARVYKAYVEKRENRTCLIAECYMLRNDSTVDVIAAIEGGIIREISVGCAISRAVCSICGNDYGTCGHQKGVIYDGEKCHCDLMDPVDAYEMSFVAVPAQPQAGVTKSINSQGVTPSDLSRAKARLQIENERWRFL